MNSLVKLSQVKWACRRGMLELDLLLGSFAESTYLTLSESDKETFLALLKYPDPDLFAWLIGKASPLDPNIATMIKQIRDDAQSKF
jgi:antitoxin CptB